MASVQRRVGSDGAVTWRVRVRVAGHPIQTQSFRRKTDAGEWAVRTEAALRDGKHLMGREAKRRTVSNLIARYRLDVIPAYGAREQGQRLGKLAWWESQVGNLLVSDLTAARVIECRARLARGEGPSGKPASPATQARYLAALKHVFSIARDEWEWTTDNPMARVRAPKEPRGRVRFLSEDERTCLLAACRSSDNRRLYPLVLLALSTGARQGELLALRWPDIDFALCQATVQESKNDERRALALSDGALASSTSRAAPGTPDPQRLGFCHQVGRCHGAKEGVGGGAPQG